MSTLLARFIDGYNDLMSKRHPRGDGYLLMSSPFPTTLLCVLYVYFVKSLGPRLMRNRQAYELKTAIRIYNIVQVLVSTYIFYGGLRYAWLWRYSYRCQPIDYSDHPDEVAGFYFCHLYFLCKFFEFLDTIFFVLRKKFDQITHLHVIHHTIMAGSLWWGARFAPSGHGTFFGLLNSFVHIIMYGYYLLASMGPEYQKYLWWKKHLTTVQMIQFVLVFVHNAQIFFIDCDYPKHLVLVMLFNSVMFLALFSNFYVQAYIKKRRLPKIKIENDNKDPPKTVNQRHVETSSSSSSSSELSQNWRFFSQLAAACFIGQNGLINGRESKLNNIAQKKQKHQ